MSDSINRSSLHKIAEISAEITGPTDRYHKGDIELYFEDDHGNFVSDILWDLRWGDNVTAKFLQAKQFETVFKSTGSSTESRIVYSIGKI